MNKIHAPLTKKALIGASLLWASTIATPAHACTDEQWDNNLVLKLPLEQSHKRAWLEESFPRHCIFVMNPKPEAKPKSPSAFAIVPTHATHKSFAMAEAERHGVNPDLVLGLIMQESRWNPHARSQAGAYGLTQLMPETAQEVGVNRYDPYDNIRGGILYLKKKLEEFDGNVTLALAAYNAGAGAVKRNGNRVPRNGETEHYVVKVKQYAGLL